jgi:hypothetical protein
MKTKFVNCKELTPITPEKPVRLHDGRCCVCQLHRHLTTAIVVGMGLLWGFAIVPAAYSQRTVGEALKAAKKANAAVKPLEILIHDPSNLFSEGEEVSFQIKFNNVPTQAQFTPEVKDFDGKVVWRGTLPAPADGKGTVTLAIGKLPLGYYELRLDPGHKVKVQLEDYRFASFGVVRPNHRTAEEVRGSDLHFGLKFGGGLPIFNDAKGVEAATMLGLHWTRMTMSTVQRQPEILKLPVRVMYKVEGIPEDSYDEKRYGPRDQYKYRHFDWRKASAPLEAPYKRWLKEQISQLPKNESVFEIWNEPWGKIPAKDYANVAQWSKDVIREVVPDAVVGPNLCMMHLPRHINYNKEFIAAGGMKGMNAVFLHLYGPPEESDLRGEIRLLRQYFASAIGRPDIDIYNSEYGSPSPPDGDRADTGEDGQASLGVRKAFVFYAEGLKGFTPQYTSQTEVDPKNKEDWYGHFRKTNQPKPALIALGTAARLIDGSTYVGDLFLKTDVGAMLFERNGHYLLALWTKDKPITVDVRVGVSAVTKIDLMGKEDRIATSGGSLRLNLTGCAVYLQSVSPELAKKTSKTLRPDQWTGVVSFKNGKKVKQVEVPVIGVMIGVNSILFTNCDESCKY